MQIKTETKFSVFHSRMSESTKASQECLNRANAGETAGGSQSEGNGKTEFPGRNIFAVAGVPAMAALIDTPMLAAVAPSGWAGAQAAIRRCTSCLLTSASSKILETREK